MAYGLIMTAVNESSLKDYERRLNSYLNNHNKDETNLPYLISEKLILTTHYYASAGTNSQEFNVAITDLFDGGMILHKHFWHPYRPPKVHQDNNAITQFQESWLSFKKTLEEDEVEYWEMDFNPILELLEFTKVNNLLLLTFLDKPFDEERAAKVLYPIKIKENPYLNV